MRLLALLTTTLLVACSGSVVVDPDQGAGGTSGSTTSNASATSASDASSVAVGTGPGPCAGHDDCPDGVCVFSTGQCAPACQGQACDDCGPGLACEPCATSSCPGCRDCKAACLALQPGQCDDSDPCPDGQACDFTPGGDESYCKPICVDGACGPTSSCEGCGTSSCCGCKDCVSICTVGGD